MKKTKITLFVGLKDKDSKQQEISTLDAYKIIKNFCLDLGGGTVSQAQGIYKGNDDIRIEETTLKAEFIDIDEKKIVETAQKIKKALNQESIIIEKTRVNTNFI